MNNQKLKKIKAAGYTVTHADEWLRLDAEEKALVSMRISLAKEVENLRKKRDITQTELAERLGTKQSGIARMERNPRNATLDSLVKALLELGSTPKKIAALF